MDQQRTLLTALTLLAHPLALLGDSPLIRRLLLSRLFGLRHSRACALLAAATVKVVVLTRAPVRYSLEFIDGPLVLRRRREERHAATMCSSVRMKLVCRLRYGYSCSGRYSSKQIKQDFLAEDSEQRLRRERRESRSSPSISLPSLLARHASTRSFVLGAGENARCSTCIVPCHCAVLCCTVSCCAVRCGTVLSTKQITKLQ